MCDWYWNIPWETGQYGYSWCPDSLRGQASAVLALAMWNKCLSLRECPTIVTHHLRILTPLYSTVCGNVLNRGTSKLSRLINDPIYGVQIDEPYICEDYIYIFPYIVIKPYVIISLTMGACVSQLAPSYHMQKVYESPRKPRGAQNLWCRGTKSVHRSGNRNYKKLRRVRNDSWVRERDGKRVSSPRRNKSGRHLGNYRGEMRSEPCEKADGEGGRWVRGGIMGAGGGGRKTRQPCHVIKEQGFQVNGLKSDIDMYFGESRLFQGTRGDVNMCNPQNNSYTAYEMAAQTLDLNFTSGVVKRRRICKPRQVHIVNGTRSRFSLYRQERCNEIQGVISKLIARESQTGKPLASMYRRTDIVRSCAPDKFTPDGTSQINEAGVYRTSQCSNLEGPRSNTLKEGKIKSLSGKSRPLEKGARNFNTWGGLDGRSVAREKGYRDTKEYHFYSSLGRHTTVSLTRYRPINLKQHQIIPDYKLDTSTRLEPVTHTNSSEITNSEILRLEKKSNCVDGKTRHSGNILGTNSARGGILNGGGTGRSGSTWEKKKYGASLTMANKWDEEKKKIGGSREPGNKLEQEREKARGSREIGNTFDQEKKKRGGTREIGNTFEKEKKSGGSREIGNTIEKEKKKNIGSREIGNVFEKKKKSRCCREIGNTFEKEKKKNIGSCEIGNTFEQEKRGGSLEIGNKFKQEKKKNGGCSRKKGRGFNGNGSVCQRNCELEPNSRIRQQRINVAISTWPGENCGVYKLTRRQGGTKHGPGKPSNSGLSPVTTGPAGHGTDEDDSANTLYWIRPTDRIRILTQIEEKKSRIARRQKAGYLMVRGSFCSLDVHLYTQPKFLCF